MAEIDIKMLLTLKDKASEKLKNFNKIVDKTDKKTKKMAAGLRVGAAAFIAAGAAAAGFTARAIGMVDELAKTADKLGVTTDQLQEWRYAAELAGINATTFDTSIQRMGRRVGEASKGLGEAKDALKELGVNIFKSDGGLRDLNDILLDTADQMSKVEDPLRRNALAMKLFDSEGVKMVNLMREGSKGINEMRREAHELNLVIGEDMIRRMEGTNEEFSKLSAVAGMKIKMALLGVANGIIAVGESLNNMPEGKFKNFLRNIGILELQPGFETTMRITRENIERIKEEITDLQETANRDGVGVTGHRGRTMRAASKAAEERLTVLRKELAEEEAILTRRQYLEDRKEIRAQQMAEAERKRLDEQARIGREKLKAAEAQAAAERAAEAALQRQRENIQSLIDQLDPTAAATKEYMDQVEMLDQAWRDGTISGEYYDKLMMALATDTEAAEEAQEAFNEKLEDAKEIYASTRTEAERMAQELEDLDKLYEGGFFQKAGFTDDESLDIYARRTFDILEQYEDKTEDTVDKVTEFWREGARNMQDAMGNTFYDWMQGKTGDMVGDFKRMIDRMVAELLASKLLTFMLGDFTKDGGALGGVVGSLAGKLGFRAEGGPVNAGQPYIVGERGPELMVPKTSGTIVPNTGMGSNNVTVNITAMDSQDVRRSLEKDKRWIAELVYGTGSTYNMGRT